VKLGLLAPRVILGLLGLLGPQVWQAPPARTQKWAT
jgi:hypothetical protein